MKEKRIVIKIGTGVLTKADGKLNRASLWHLVDVVSQLQNKGFSCILVSSGAVGAGVEAFQLSSYPEDLATKQACAAVGQSSLMQVYQNLFENFELNVAQILLAPQDFNVDTQKALLNNCLSRLLDEPKVIPIVNENDVTAVEELKFGDNDQLSARVAQLIQAECLFLLTSTDGLLPPDGGCIIDEVEAIDTVIDFANGETGKFSTGGMASKLQAIKKSVEAGIETFIINGENPERILDYLGNHPENAIGTRFLPQEA